MRPPAKGFVKVCGASNNGHTCSRNTHPIFLHTAYDVSNALACSASIFDTATGACSGLVGCGCDPGTATTMAPNKQMYRSTCGKTHKLNGAAIKEVSALHSCDCIDQCKAFTGCNYWEFATATGNCRFIGSAAAGARSSAPGFNAGPPSCYWRADNGECPYTPSPPTDAPPTPAPDVTCTVMGFTCTAGYQLIPAAATTDCPGSQPTDCNNGLCCEATCGSFTCPAGSTQKAGVILCGPGCTNVKCCDAACSNGGFTCGAAKVKKTAAATIRCGATSAGCNDALCCDDSCASHSCAAGTMLIAGASTKACPAGCTAALCCDAACSNTGFTCTAPLTKTTAAASTRCGSTVASCTQAICCGAVCAAYSCPAGFMDKSNNAAISCGLVVGDCSNAICCDANCKDHVCGMGALRPSPDTARCGAQKSDCSDVLCCSIYCDAYACPAGFADGPNKATTQCGATLANCSTKKCCEVSCSNVAFGCTSGFSKIGTAPMLACGQTAADCTDALCCEATCGAHTCSAGMNAKPNALTLKCGKLSSDCDDLQCCNANCLGFVCSAGFAARAFPALEVCGSTKASCTDATCCDAQCRHASVTCSANFQKITGAKVCGPVLADCTAAKCCEALCTTFACNAGFLDKANKAAVTCGALASDCTDAKCCDASCANAAFTCTANKLKKTTAASIACGATSAQCTDAACCDVACSDAAYTCAAGYQKGTDAATVACGATVSDCTRLACCDLLCTDFACGVGQKKRVGGVCGKAPTSCTNTKCCDLTCDYMDVQCPDKHLLKPDPATTVCGAAVSDCTNALCCRATCEVHTCPAGFTITDKTKQCGVTPVDCTDAVCCEALCTHAAFTCGAGFKPKVAASTTVCGATPAACTVAKCCDATCVGYTCPTGYTADVPKADAACDPGKQDCTSFCCVRTCDNAGFSCSAGFKTKANPSTIPCIRSTGSVQCDDEICCDASCANPAFKCGKGRKIRVSPAAIVCGPLPADCVDDKCCTATCEAHTCTTPGFRLASAKLADLCGTLLADCTDARCCEALCTLHKCSAGTKPKPVTPIVCGTAASDCSDAKCCDKACSGYTCPPGYKSGSSTQNTLCDPATQECTAICCLVTCGLMDFACSAGFNLRPNAAANVCGKTRSECTDATCCDATCATHACLVGRKDKTDQASIMCNSSGCDDATCCDFLCSNSAYECPAKFRKIDTAASVICKNVLSPLYCTPETCCEALCSQHQCSTGFKDKTNKDTLVCGTLPADCSDEKCCDVTCDNTMYQCPSGTVLKKNPKDILCGATAAACTEDLCCDGSCSTFACSASFTRKAVPSGQQPILCGPTLGDCTDKICCNKNCEDYACPGGLSLKSTPADIICGPGKDNCTNALCCDATCSHAEATCDMDYGKKVGAANITCGATASACTNTLCCDATCVRYDCEAGFYNRTGKEDILCGAGFADCTGDTCCQPSCNNTQFTCGAGVILKANASRITCGDTVAGCDDNLCCDFSCSRTPCPAGQYMDRASKANIMCGSINACTVARCCDAVCGNTNFVCAPSWEKRPNAAAISCGNGATAGDCINNLCCTPVTNAPTPVPDTAEPGTTPPLMLVDVELEWTVRPTVRPKEIAEGTVMVQVRMLGTAGRYIEFRRWPAHKRPEGMTMVSDRDQELGIMWAVDHPQSGSLFKFVSRTNDTLTFVIHIPQYAAQIDEHVTLAISKDMFKAKTGMPYVVYTRTTNAKPVLFTVEFPSEKWQEAMAVGAGTATILLGPTALQAQTVAFLAMMECGARESSDPKAAETWMFHPTQTKLNGRLCLGAAVFNSTIVLGAFLLQLFIAFLVLRFDKKKILMQDPKTFLVAQAVIFCPSLTIVVLMGVYQGTSACAAALIFRPDDNIANMILGLITLFAQIAIIILLQIVLSDSKKLCRYRMEMDATGKIVGGKIRHFIMGKGEWVSTCRKTLFVKRYSIILRSWAASYTFFCTTDFSASIIFSLLGTIRPETYPGCGTLRLIIGLVSLVMGGLLWFFWPFVKERDNYTQVGRFLAQGIGFIFLGVAYYLRAPKTHATSYIGSIFVLISIILLCVKSLLDMLMFAYLHWTGRRTKLQMEEWGDIDNRNRGGEDIGDDAPKVTWEEMMADLNTPGGGGDDERLIEDDTGDEEAEMFSEGSDLEAELVSKAQTREKDVCGHPPPPPHPYRQTHTPRHAQRRRTSTTVLCPWSPNPTLRKTTACGGRSTLWRCRQAKAASTAAATAATRC